jgi:hypothetical protein
MGWFSPRVTLQNTIGREVKTSIFCHHDKTIKHLFQCNFARSIWPTIQIGSILYPPRTVANIFSNWLSGVDNMFKLLIRVGETAVIWSLRVCRNDKVLNNKSSSLMHAIYCCTTTFRLCLPLHRAENYDLFMEVSTQLYDTMKDIFWQHGWQRDLRIVPPSP